MRFLTSFIAVNLLYLSTFAAHAAVSDWMYSPQPEFPPSALQKSVEGVVKLRLLVSNDGRVAKASVVQSSGNKSLDDAARDAASKWRLKPSAVKPSDLSRGRIEEIEFRQEAMRSATYPKDVRAGFGDEKMWKLWVHAPFPYYPIGARRLRHTGTVIVAATIGADGWVAGVQVTKSSGFRDLDELAVNAVHHWRAHKELAGHSISVPVTFTMGFEERGPHGA